MSIVDIENLVNQKNKSAKLSKENEKKQLNIRDFLRKQPVNNKQYFQPEIKHETPVNIKIDENIENNIIDFISIPAGLKKDKLAEKIKNDNNMKEIMRGSFISKVNTVNNNMKFGIMYSLHFISTICEK